MSPPLLFFYLIKIFSIEIENSDLGLGHSPILFSRNFFCFDSKPEKKKKKQKKKNSKSNERGAFDFGRGISRPFDHF
jgi:hypothetical protein